MKAIGTGWRRGVTWQDFEVVSRSHGLSMRLSGRAAEIASQQGADRIWLAAAVSKSHAIAQVVLESTGAPPATP
jgi:holo-[acyl-carrier protein] synthase